MGEVIKDEASYNPPPADSQWLTFEEGITTIRLLSHSYSFRSHYIKKERKSYDCTGDVSTCKWCQLGNRSGGKWAYMVLVRDEKAPAIKVMEAGWSIFETILNLAKDKDYGDPRGYDLKITRKGTGTDTSYTVIPGKDTKFNDKEDKLVSGQGLANPKTATDKLMSFYRGEDSEEEVPGEEDIPFD